MKLTSGWGAALALIVATTSSAQESLENRCDDPRVRDAGAYDACIAAAQAVSSAQPVLGILIAGGSPTIGTAGGSGLRLGVIPRVTAGLRLNVVPIRLPDIVADQVPGQGSGFARRYGAPVPALSGDLSVGITRGFEVGPGVGGLGAISLLGSASYLPFEMFTDDFERSDLAYGFGARVQILDESFVAPAVSLSGMRRELGRVEFGNVCPSGFVPVSGGGTDTQVGGCTGPGDAGEIAFDLESWSVRAIASKRLLGVGAALGLGWDSYDSEIDFGFRGTQIIGGAAPAFRVRNERLESTRWSVFGSLSYSLLVSTLALEAGWQQGTSPLGGFRNLQSDFNPRAGSWFGSLGARLSL